MRAPCYMAPLEPRPQRRFMEGAKKVLEGAAGAEAIGAPAVRQ